MSEYKRSLMKHQVLKLIANDKMRKEHCTGIVFTCPGQSVVASFLRLLAHFGV